MVTSVEIYKILKEHVGEEVARVIVEEFARADQVATKSDIEGVNRNIETLGQTLSLKIDGAITGSEARTFRWMLGFFATLWVAQSAMIVAIVTKL